MANTIVFVFHIAPVVHLLNLKMECSVWKSNDPTVICSTPLQEKDKLKDIKTPHISTRFNLAREAQTAVMNGLQVSNYIYFNFTIKETNSLSK